jgi:histidine triad (HIT) family protein
MMNCLFCAIANKEKGSVVVFEDEIAMAFLDHRPLFPGHCLLVPKEHFETLTDLPAKQVGAFFQDVQLIATAVQSALDAEGSFIAINNRVSQSVPHLHVHIVPRRKKDGLKGFFWPRYKYQSEEEMAEVGQSIRAAISLLRTGQ